MLRCIHFLPDVHGDMSLNFTDCRLQFEHSKVTMPKYRWFWNGHFPQQNMPRKIRRRYNIFTKIGSVEAGGSPASNGIKIKKRKIFFLIFRPMFCWGKCNFWTKIFKFFLARNITKQNRRWITKKIFFNSLTFL